MNETKCTIGIDLHLKQEEPNLIVVVMRRLGIIDGYDYDVMHVSAVTGSVADTLKVVNRLKNEYSTTDVITDYPVIGALPGVTPYPVRGQKHAEALDMAAQFISAPQEAKRIAALVMEYMGKSGT